MSIASLSIICIILSRMSTTWSLIAKICLVELLTGYQDRDDAGVAVSWTGMADSALLLGVVVG
jgi:hypothetical protein